MTRPRSALHRVLTHPLVVAGKGPIRNALWMARGRGLANPRFPPGVASVLFVCKGNICRSPFARLRAAQLLEEAGISGVSVRCAGLAVKTGERPPREAFEAAASFGISLDGHTAVQLSRELLMAHDITVAMEAGQLRALREQYPEAADRMFLLALLDDGAEAGYERFNIPDPFGQAVETFESCYRRIDKALRSLLHSVRGTAVPERDGFSELPGERR